MVFIDQSLQFGDGDLIVQ